ncbi:MAG TPA: hypothetical protein VHE79_07760, partial [Spirochaetia bacterium]
MRAELEALGIPGGREGAGGVGADGAGSGASGRGSAAGGADPSGLVGASGTDVRVEDLRVVFPAAPRDVALCTAAPGSATWRMPRRS